MAVRNSPALASCSTQAGWTILSSQLQVYPAFLAVAVLLGFVLGIAGAVLLYIFVLEPALQRKEHCSSGTDDDSCSEYSDDSQSFKSNEDERGTKRGASPYYEENETSLNSNIAAFALKARVIYPINQKFRPLADGSSHPSLLEGLKQRDSTKRTKEDFVLSDPEFLDLKSERDYNCFPGNYPPSTTVCNENNTIPIVMFFSELLGYTSPEAELGLYRFSLQTLRLLDAEIRQEQYMIFLQLLKLQLNDLYLKEKIDETFYRDFLSTQEKELEKLQNLEQPVLLGDTSRKDCEQHYTLEEAEQDEHSYLQYTIHQLSGFFKQTESVWSSFLNHSKLPKITVQELMRNISEKMLQVEVLLTDSLTFQITVILDRLLHWEYMTKSLQSLTWLVQQESKDKLMMVTSVLSVLNRDGTLAFWQKEEILARIQHSVQDNVDTYINACAKQTKDLILEMKRRHRTLMKRLEETQRHERLNLKEQATQMLTPTEFIQKQEKQHAREGGCWVNIMKQRKLWMLEIGNMQKQIAEETHQSCHELAERHRQTRCDVEDKENHNDVKAVTKLWKNLHTKSSRTLDKLMEELFTETLPKLTSVSLPAMETLRSRLQQDLTARKKAAAVERKQQLKQFHEKLAQMKQVWMDEKVINSVKQKYLIDKQEKIIQGFLLRQSDLEEMVSEHIILEHQVALQPMLRQLTLRHFSLLILKEMRLFKAKCLFSELEEQRMKEPPIWDQLEDENVKLQDNEMSKFSEDQRKLWKNADVIIHQQLAAECQAFVDLLQHHMARNIGHALTHQARVHSFKQNHDDNTQKLKNLLVERTTESVYVTMESVTNLIQNYDQKIEEIMDVYQKDKKNQLSFMQETFKRQKLSKEAALEDKLKADLVSVKTNPLLPRRIQHQLVLQQKRIISMLLLEEETNMEFLKKRTMLLHQLKEQVDSHLKVAEKTFMSQLAALARVPKADWKTLEKKFLSGIGCKRISPRVNHWVELQLDAL
ncbi:evC complex member EVC-like isoform X2 [Stegostoma tigrinum]|uniref:evC complex member EVC-like isoform X2 n=1 Tax=Stegostoma tigrinum TaxID=3053191 RepID=UPI00202B41E2|nr:evC complex member EVC-like isoform X2 [Stegostoma tigrinum]